MKLAELLEGVAGAAVRGDPATEIRGLAYHTRDVVDGTLFFCVPGLKFDGHAFAARAAAAGAAALVCEHDTGVALPQVLVPSVRRAMALVAARWYGHPSRELAVVGVTGTNGKTTTAHLVAGIFAAAGRPAALLGTVVNRIGGRDEPVRLTTAVDKGTGTKAQIPGYKVAGKTGTAEKPLPNGGGYSQTDFVASFIGMVPADHPRLVVLVAVDSPRSSIYGGDIAAPAVQKIMRFALQHLEIAP